MGQPKGGQWLVDDFMTCQSLKAQQRWLGLDCSPLPCLPVAGSSPRLPNSQGPQGPPQQRWSQVVPLPCSQQPLLGLGPRLRGEGEEKGLASRGAEAVLQSSEQVGSVLALDQIVECRGHCTEAGLG